MTTLERHTPAVGDRIGRYELIEELGRGGFGIVFRARQAGLDAEVAVKLMLAEETREARELKLRERFEQEARVIKELEHPCTVKVRDFGHTHEGFPYLVTELVRGKHLGAVLAAEGPFKVERTVRIGTQILGCLAEAHHKGIVHRDLKPQNVMLTDLYGEPDTVKLLDFGIAKVAADRGGVRTQTGQAFGTPQYLSPEQCRGVKDLDGRVDLYALGLILAECLAGEPVVEDLDALSAVMRHASPTPHRLAPLILASPLYPVIRTAIAKSRDERYPHALAMREALVAAAAASGQESTAKPKGRKAAKAAQARPPKAAPEPTPSTPPREAVGPPQVARTPALPPTMKLRGPTAQSKPAASAASPLAPARAKSIEEVPTSPILEPPASVVVSQAASRLDGPTDVIRTPPPEIVEPDSAALSTPADEHPMPRRERRPAVIAAVGVVIGALLWLLFDAGGWVLGAGLAGVILVGLLWVLLQPAD